VGQNRVWLGPIDFAFARIGFGKFARVARVAGCDSRDCAAVLTGTVYEGCCSHFGKSFGRCMV
jgi:hypothetical protein